MSSGLWVGGLGGAWQTVGAQMFPRGRFLLQLSPTDDPESVYIYDLMATVVHILDSRTGGSLVGHIKVGETYHQRKEVRTLRDGCSPSHRLPRAPWESCLAEASLPHGLLRARAVEQTRSWVSCKC